MSAKTHAGSCHCGAVRFEVDLDLDAGVSRCNCTMCTKTQMANAVVKPEAFRLLSGADHLIDYQRPGSPNRFPFCKTCGVRGFGSGDIPELGGAYVSINVTCLDDVDVDTIPTVYWDGRHDNWEAGSRERPWPSRT